MSGAGKGDTPRTTPAYWKSSYWLKRDAEKGLPEAVKDRNLPEPAKGWDRGEKPFPAGVCSDCGQVYGKHLPESASYQYGECGVCGAKRMLTSPRNYGGLDESWKGHS